MKRWHTFISAGFVIALVLCNLHLVANDLLPMLHFDITEVRNGEWWRIITHPFVHVSWYHLLLDGAAVSILWKEIRLPSPLHKLIVAACCGSCSLIFAACFSPEVQIYGLCGLSGTAHGMMFFLGLSWIARSFHRTYPEKRISLFAGLALCAMSGLIEWWVAVLSGSSAEAFLGTQGYVWDTQSDMALALLGSIASLTLLRSLHDRQIASL